MKHKASISQAAEKGEEELDKKGLGLGFNGVFRQVEGVLNLKQKFLGRF